MQYQELQKLASLLNDNIQGETSKSGFVVIPRDEIRLRDHRNAMTNRNSMFDCTPQNGEKMGIAFVRRITAIDSSYGAQVDYFPTLIEYLGCPELCIDNPKVNTLFEDYVTYALRR